MRTTYRHFNTRTQLPAPAEPRNLHLVTLEMDICRRKKNPCVHTDFMKPRGALSSLQHCEGSPAANCSLLDVKSEFNRVCVCVCVCVCLRAWVHTHIILGLEIFSRLNNNGWHMAAIVPAQPGRSRGRSQMS